jgi:hypothetical protein
MRKLFFRLANMLRNRGWSESMTCPVCHWDMSLVDIETGYSCHNPVCKLHVGAL